MGIVKQIDIKNRTYYLYNDMISIKNFNPVMLKIDRKSYKDISIQVLGILGILGIGYIAIYKIDDYESIYSINPFYLIVNHASGYTEGKMEINT